MAMYQGKSFIERALDLTEGLFEKRVVLTRSAEIVDTCKSYGVEVILHELEGRNEAVALGISEMQGMDACVFCPCDQPLLKRSSVEILTGAFAGSRENSIIRLSHENLDGTPVLFSKEYFEELCDLPEKKGGGYLAAKYPENVIRVQVTDPTELWDIDTEEDYKKLIAEY
jgi:molybdenum cofactor cytidylyltransferase